MDKQESLFYICVEVNSSNSLSGFCHPHFLILCEEKYGSCQVNYDCFGFFLLAAETAAYCTIEIVAEATLGYG